MKCRSVADASQTGEPLESSYPAAAGVENARGIGVHRARQAGLATSEWLLVVAAVAGLAALAVVLVQFVVDDTAEQVAASPARRTAAAVAAREVERQARDATAANPRKATWADWDRHFSARCARLEIVYGDVVDGVDAAFARPTAADGADPISEGALAAASESGPSASAAQVRCSIGETRGGVAADEVPPSPDDPPSADPPPPPSVEDFRRAAQAIARAAATLRPGDTWASWEAHFGSLCSDLARDYAHLLITVVSQFNRPADQSDAAVTQHLLDAATTAAPGNGRPRIKCEAAKE